MPAIFIDCPKDLQGLRVFIFFLVSGKGLCYILKQSNSCWDISEVLHGIYRMFVQMIVYDFRKVA